MNDIKKSIEVLKEQIIKNEKILDGLPEKARARATDLSNVVKACHVAISALENNEQLKRDLATQNEYSERLAERLRATNNLLKKARKKQLNSGWFPVSEWLPNNCGLGVLLTIENKFQQRKVIQGFTGYMEKGKLEFHTNDKTTDLEIWKVIAWQPLPSVYKEVGNE